MRKKLRRLGLEGTEIKNYPKKGYSLVANVVYELNLAEPPQDPQSAQLNNKEVFISLLALVTTIAAFLIFNIKSDSSSEHIPPVLNQAIQLLDDEYEKIDLATNNETNQIVFATRESEEQNWHLVVLNTYSLEQQIISDQRFNFRSPDWLDNQTLVFRAYNGDECAIKRIDITNFDAKAVSLFPCNELTTGKGLSVLNSNTVLFTDAVYDIAPATMFMGDITTGKVTKVEALDSTGVGIYDIQSSTHSDLVAIISSPDWKGSEVHLLDVDDNWRSVWQTHTKNAKHSVSWDGKSLLHANDKGGVTAHLFDASRFLKSIEMSGFSKLHNFSGSDSSVAFRRGSMYRTDILISSNDDHFSDANLLVNTPATNKMAQFINENTVLYISDITGIEQLWTLDISSHVKRQISMFEEAKQIDNIAFNKAQQLVAIETDNAISLYNLTNNTLVKSAIQRIEGKRPVFFNGQLLFATKDKTDNYNINAYDLKTQRVLSPFIRGAFEAKVSDNQLFYTKFYQPGLWQHKALDKDKLVTNMSQNVASWFVDGDRLIYQQSDQAPKLINLATKQQTQLAAQSCQHITDFKYGKCLSRVFKPNNTQLMLAKSLH